MKRKYPWFLITGLLITVVLLHAVLFFIQAKLHLSTSSIVLIGAAISIAILGLVFLLDHVGEVNKVSIENIIDKQTEIFQQLSKELRPAINRLNRMMNSNKVPQSDLKSELELNTINFIGNKFLRTLEDALDWLRIEAETLPREEQRFDLEESIGEIFQLLSHIAKERSVELYYALEDDVPVACMGEMTRLRQVWYYIISYLIHQGEKQELLVEGKKIGHKGVNNMLEFNFKLTGRPAQNSKDETDWNWNMAEILTSWLQAEITRNISSTELSITFKISLTESSNRTNKAANEGRFLGKEALVLCRESVLQEVIQAKCGHWGMKIEVADFLDEGIRIIKKLTHLDLVFVDEGFEQGEGFRKIGELIRSQFPNAPIYWISYPGNFDDFSNGNLISSYLSKPFRQSNLEDKISENLIIKPIESATVPLSQSEDLKILVAEDNPVSQMIIKRHLRELGHNADMVSNGLEAVEAAGKEKYDIILLDIQMPVLNGLDAARKINKMSRSHVAPVLVAITASEKDEVEETCLLAGIDDLMKKPINLQMLKKLIKYHFVDKAVEDNQESHFL